MGPGWVVATNLLLMLWNKSRSIGLWLGGRQNDYNVLNIEVKSIFQNNGCREDPQSREANEGRSHHPIVCLANPQKPSGWNPSWLRDARISSKGRWVRSNMDTSKMIGRRHPEDGPRVGHLYWKKPVAYSPRGQKEPSRIQWVTATLGEAHSLSSPMCILSRVLCL